MAAKDTTGRWERVARRLPGTECDHALAAAEMAKRHASEGFYAFDDPLESVLFSVLVEILAEKERRRVDR